MARIITSIIDGVADITQEGFGIPAVFGETEQFNVLKVGIGKSKLIFSTPARGGVASVEIVESGAVSSPEFSEAGTKVTLKIPTTGATAKECKTEYDDNASPAVKLLIDLNLDTSGTGQVDEIVETPLTSSDEIVITAIGQVNDLMLPYYLSTDPEFRKVQQLYNQDLSPERIYVFNASEDSSGDDFNTRIAQFDNQDFYFLILTSTVKADIVEAATWTDQNGKVLGALSDDLTLADELATNNGVFLTVTLTSLLDEDPEAAIIGLQAPKTPGSTTWDWKRVNGVTGITDPGTINTVINGKKSNLFIVQSNITHYTPGRMTDGKFIDQRRSRDYMNARIREAFLRAFTTTEKFSFDDKGFSSLVNVLAGELGNFGDDNILAEAISTEEVALSFDNVYQFNITAKTRAQLLQSDPQSIVDREYELEYSFVEAGAIQDLTITGKVVLGL